MRAYENDNIKLPKILSLLSTKSIDRLSKIVYFFTWRAPRKKQSSTGCKTKFYL